MEVDLIHSGSLCISVLLMITAGGHTYTAALLPVIVLPGVTNAGCYVHKCIHVIRFWPSKCSLFSKITSNLEVVELKSDFRISPQCK
jgi:hypothetical protein